MSAQPKALKLADMATALNMLPIQEAAAMLRSQHEAIQELRAALQPFVEFNSSLETIYVQVRTADVTRARAAIKATGGHKP